MVGRILLALKQLSMVAALTLLTHMTWQIFIKERTIGNIFWSTDQIAQWELDRGNLQTAAELFDDPLRRGTAYYLATDFEQAAIQFSRVDSAEGSFNLGNALAHQEKWEEAAAAYEDALERKPNYPSAASNLEIIRRLIPKEIERQGGEGTGGQLPPDDIVFDEASLGSGGEEVEIRQTELTDQQITEMWMRRLTTSPADFLRLKFSYQQARKEARRQ